jgi:hypothetical protein
MIGKKYQAILLIVFTSILMGVLLLMGLSAPVTQAGSGLPGRNTPTPTPPPSSDGDDDNDGGPIGAYIELHVPDAPAGAWTVVQWQNELDDWYDVEGWRGTLDEQGRRRWWVAKKDFGTGPFRWVVKQGPNGSVLGSSTPFNLPVEVNQTLPVEVKL